MRVVRCGQYLSVLLTHSHAYTYARTQAHTRAHTHLTKHLTFYKVFLFVLFLILVGALIQNFIFLCWILRPLCLSIDHNVDKEHLCFSKTCLNVGETSIYLGLSSPVVDSSFTKKENNDSISLIEFD